MNDDASLLQRYAETGSEADFATLVNRHLDMVWSTARRITGDDELAKDVSQMVFADLARKARWLSGHVYLQTQITIMKTQLLITAAAALFVATPLVLQQRSINSARAELAGLRQNLLMSESPNSSQTPGGIDPSELARLKGSRDELGRLRDEAERLRQAQDPSLLARLKEARASSQAAQAAASEAAEEIEAEGVRRRTISVGKNLGLGARIFATSNSDHFPTKFEEMKDALSSIYDEAFEKFEFFPQPRPLSENEPQPFLFREKKPRRFGGRWERSYCRSDGSVVNLTSDTTDFTQNLARTVKCSIDI